MSKTLVITDTCSDLTGNATAGFDIEILSTTCRINSKRYSENIDFINKNFYVLMDDRSQIESFKIRPSVYLERFTNAEKDGYRNVIVITIFSNLASMYDSAVEAKQMYEKYNPDSKLKIAVIDSLTQSIGTGYLALYAAKVAKKTRDIEEIVRLCEEFKKSITLLVDSFMIKNLPVSGPFEWFEKTVNSIAKSFPSIIMKEGKPEELPIEKIDHTAFDQFYNFCKDEITKGDKKYAVGFAVREKEAQALSLLLEKETSIKPDFIYYEGAFSSYFNSRASIIVCICDKF
ncbi:MAG: DegV family protein [Clostridia bacterium]|nr:DegV family protein [Clostridia bacterium]